MAVDVLGATVMSAFTERYHSSSAENQGNESRDRILKASLHLFAQRGFDGTTTKEIARVAQVAEGTIFRHFHNKKAILIEIATGGWVELLTDLLTELSEMGSYKAIAQVMRHRMVNLRHNSELLRVCFIEAQFHPELVKQIQDDVIAKMTSVAEAFFATAMERGVYRPLNPQVVARVFLGMFTIASFSQDALLSSQTSPVEMKEMAEGLADIFLHGVLAPETPS